MKKYVHSAITLASVAAVFTFMSCGPKKPAQGANPEEVETLYAVSTYKTVAGNLDDYLEFGGDVA